MHGEDTFHVGRRHGRVTFLAAGGLHAHGQLSTIAGRLDLRQQGGSPGIVEMERFTRRGLRVIRRQWRIDDRRFFATTDSQERQDHSRGSPQNPFHITSVRYP